MTRRFLMITWVVCGSLAIVYLLSMFILAEFPRVLCDVTVIDSAVSGDRDVKATVYMAECGAMAADRVSVALSHPMVDGTRDGTTVVALINANRDSVAIRWKTNRELVVAHKGELEYVVALTRGVKITLETLNTDRDEPASSR